jgi:hypothetical protein
MKQRLRIRRVVPGITPLPAGDEGGAATSYVSLAPYRAAGNLDYGPSSPWAHRPLPVTQAARDAITLNGLTGLSAATSDNWRLHCCSMFGIDPTTGAVVTATQGGNTPMYMRVAGEHIYVVGNTEPLRPFTDLDVSVNGWATTFNDTVASLGGLPIPADALPHITPDRYAFVYQPPDTWVTIYAFQPLVAERATLRLNGSGGHLEFDYTDSANQKLQTFICSPVPTGSTAADLQALIFAAETSTGVVFGAKRANTTPVDCAGGPLGSAPITVTWPVAMAMRPVVVRGDLQVEYVQNAQPWSGGRLCGITSPNVPNGHVPSAGQGVSSNEGGTAAATGIDWMPLIIDWDEYNTAYENGIANGWDAPGTDLGHVIAMSIGNAGTGFVYPAIRSDGTLSNTDGSKVKEGALGTFPVAADASKVAPEMMPIFNTIKRYGFIPIDKTGGGAELIFRNWGFPGTSPPFPGPAAFQLNSAKYTPYMRGLPWHQLQFIDPAQVKAGW